MPKTNANTARKLARLSSDCSFLLSHLVRQNDGCSDEDSKTRLKSILNLYGNTVTKVLKASSVGWYGAAPGTNIYNPISGEFNGSNNSRAVCFTESTLAGLKAHRDIFEVKYGLAFDRDRLFELGANPCLNIRSSLFKESFRVQDERYDRYIYNFIPNQLHPFINIITESFDATHEREWRHSGDLAFEYSDVRFVFCPEADFSTFSSIQSDGLPVLFDLEWLNRI